MEKVKVRKADGTEQMGVVVEAREFAQWELKHRMKVVEHSTPGQLEALLAECQDVTETPIDIDDYHHRASTVTAFAKLLWTNVGPPNLFHWHIKRIDPSVYGRPETFRAECRRLHSELEMILRLYDEKANNVDLASCVCPWLRDQASPKPGGDGP